MWRVGIWERWVVVDEMTYTYTHHYSMNIRPFKSNSELVNWNTSITLAIL